MTEGWTGTWGESLLLASYQLPPGRPGVRLARSLPSAHSHFGLKRTLPCEPPDARLSPSQDHAALEAEKQKMSALVRGLQRELEETSEETGHWQSLFQKNKEELRATKQE